MQWRAHEHSPDLRPHFSLLIKRLNVTERTNFGGQTKKLEKPADDLDRETRPSAFVEASAEREHVSMVEPVLQGMTRHVRAEFVDQHAAEVVVAAFSEKLPGVRI
jgi:hypothetical protein